MMKSKNKGITLISLVVTIIVLLILSGIALNLTIGQNGLISRATKAREQSERVSIKEELEMAVLASKINNNINTTIDKYMLERELNETYQIVDISKEGEDNELPWTIKKDGYTYKIDSTGEVYEIIELTAKQIATDPQKYSGASVLNYKANNEDKSIYRIFYVDKENYFGDGNNTIYLKADYTTVNYNLNNYLSYDETNTKVKSMNPIWAEQRKTANWNINEKAAAYLCSPVTEDNYTVTTSLPWNAFYKPNDIRVNYVIGGPSIEMYVASYNQTHDSNSLGYQYQNNITPGYGYKVNGTIQNNGWFTNGYILDYSLKFDSMYCGKNGNNEGYWWIASPAAGDSNGVCYVSGNYANLHYQNYSYNIGISPLISLKADFKLQIKID